MCSFETFVTSAGNCDRFEQSDSAVYSEDRIQLGVKSRSCEGTHVASTKKIMDVTALSEETVEIIEMTLAGDDNPQVTTRFLSEAEIVQLANERDTRT